MKLLGVKQIINRGVLQQEIAERARISPEQLSRYLNGKSNPTFITLEKIARACGLTLDQAENGTR